MCRAFSSEVGTGSREENASKQETRASVLIESKLKLSLCQLRRIRLRYRAAEVTNRGPAPCGPRA
ncbi:hypothetical protein FNJ47_21750 [Bradyrhizobium sp. UFLA 03-164]|uniref:Uncharacterized protein n=1 Tax=Bradyrhizobium uaiense TaxID=2594946 RepID=A0A6P1BJE0_9BRAD|nr:hypothetical protein [Bradyrhizobium uaiense]